MGRVVNRNFEKKNKKDLWDKHKLYVNKFVRSNQGSKRAQGAKKGRRDYRNHS